MKRHVKKHVPDAIDMGVNRAVAKALAEHKKAGRPIAVWKNGKVVEIPANKIKVPRI